jgi:hypothetical protein
MRARFAILCGVLLFSIMVPTTAHAGSWSAFVAWLSDLDPKSGGIGIEMRLFCPGATGAAVDNVSAEFACDPDTRQKFVIKASAAILLGTLNDNGGTVSVLPVLGSVETDINDRFSVGGGAGVIHVGGTLVGAVTRPLIQAQVTFKIPNVKLGVRPELNLIPKGFPAGAFAVDAPETGTEVVPGLSFVVTFK